MSACVLLELDIKLELVTMVIVAATFIATASQ